MTSSAFGVVRDFSFALLDFVYPAFCLVCEQQLAWREKHVCQRCWDELPLHENSRILPAELRHRGFSQLFSLWPFGDDVQKIIHELKYSRMLSLGQRIGRSLAAALASNRDYLQADLIIPVPLHPSKFRERGYNQSAVIAKALAAATGMQARVDVLRRKRNTRSQAKLNVEERQANMIGAFEVKKPAVVAGKTVIVLDDVCTTGATLQGCAETLLSAGVINVLGLTAAYTSLAE